MKSFVATLLATVATASLKSKYMSYVVEHSKGYHTVDEFARHEAHFIETEVFINEHNMSNTSFSVAHNFISDMTEEQKAHLRGRIPRRTLKTTEPVLLSEEGVPSTVDWITMGAVNPVQDQGQCGSCWAFSSVASLEGAHWLATRNLLKFSEQQLVDCAGFKYGNYGCNGGLEDNAFKYYETNKAILGADYPYTGKNGSCQYDSLSNSGVEVSTYLDVAADNLNQLTAAVAQQVVSIAIEADKRVFQQYSTGIFDSDSCGTNLDHAVAIVGYGIDYWLVRNSWGTSWGEAGYIKIAKTSGDGVCGINMEPVYPSSD